MAFNISIPKDKAGQQKLFLVIIPILIFVGYYQFMHGKKKLAGDELQTRLEELEQKNGAAKAIALTGGPELQQKLALYEQHLQRLEELIPRSEEVATLLNSLAERAMDTNVDLSLMKPETSEPGEFYTEQTYRVNAIGTYHDVGRYLAAIASGPRIVTPVELKLKPRPPAEATREGVPRLTADFRIVTYVIPVAAEQPAPGGASGSH
jgi:Tfp pilus assembly protein PilO